MGAKFLRWEAGAVLMIKSTGCLDGYALQHKHKANLHPTIVIVLKGKIL
jgi:hypothetical protein